MPAQPTDLARALEQALARVLNSNEFRAAINDFVTPREQIEVLTIDTLSDTTPEEEVGVEVELQDEYSGRTETYHLKITEDRALPLAALPRTA